MISAPVFIATIFVIGLFLLILVVRAVALWILPLVVKDYAPTDSKDILSNITTHHLRKYFDFSGLLSKKNLHHNNIYLLGD